MSPFLKYKTKNGYEATIFHIANGYLHGVVEGDEFFIFMIWNMDGFTLRKFEEFNLVFSDE